MREDQRQTDYRSGKKTLYRFQPLPGGRCPRGAGPGGKDGRVPRGQRGLPADQGECPHRPGRTGGHLPGYRAWRSSSWSWDRKCTSPGEILTRPSMRGQAGIQGRLSSQILLPPLHPGQYERQHPGHYPLIPWFPGIRLRSFWLPKGGEQRTCLR